MEDREAGQVGRLAQVEAVQVDTPEAGLVEECQTLLGTMWPLGGEAEGFPQVSGGTGLHREGSGQPVGLMR